MSSNVSFTELPEMSLSIQLHWAANLSSGEIQKIFFKTLNDSMN